MYACDTGEMPVIDLKNMARIPLSVEEAKDIGEAVAAVRSYGHGTGEVCLPIVNGFIEAILPTLKKFRKKLAKKAS